MSTVLIKNDTIGTDLPEQDLHYSLTGSRTVLICTDQASHWILPALVAWWLSMKPAKQLDVEKSSKLLSAGLI